MLKIEKFLIVNYRCYEKVGFSVGCVNIFVGANNSGKTSILRSLFSFQSGAEAGHKDIRMLERDAHVYLYVRKIPTELGLGIFFETKNMFLFHKAIESISENVMISEEGTSSVDGRTLIVRNNSRAIDCLPGDYNKSVFIPFFSKRKSNGLQEQVRRDQSENIRGDLSHLVARISSVINPTHPGNAYFSDACRKILGFSIGLVPSQNGQLPGVFISANDVIEIGSMGEGVLQIVGLLEYLATVENKIFLIEELENDLHPKALKELLSLIAISAKERGNQFFITTHSNIVVSQLGGLDGSKIFSVKSIPGARIPTSTVEEVGHDPQDRLQVLEDLGYAASDYGMHEGWLFFEESSAETIIKKFIIPWFAPKLSGFQTFSAAGADNLRPKFENFKNLVTYMHLEPIYKERAWVFADGDSKGRQVVDDLRKSFGDWNGDRFNCFDKHFFEMYYPESFSKNVTDVLAMDNSHKKEKMSAKRELLKNVVAWLGEDEDRGRDALKKSAAELIDKLKKVEEAISLLNSNVDQEKIILSDD